MARPALRIDVSDKDQKKLRKLVSGGAQQVGVVLRALALLQLAKGVTAPSRHRRNSIDGTSDPQW
jgi:hypothetical protein